MKTLAKSIATKCGLKGKHTTHSFRRAAATTLAESGMSIVALSPAGRWKIYKTAEGHTEYRNVEKDDRMSRLDGNAVVPKNTVVPCAVVPDNTVVSHNKSRLDECTTGDGNGKA